MDKIQNYCTAQQEIRTVTTVLWTGRYKLRNKKKKI